MEARAVALKFCAKRRREENNIKDTFKHKIDEIKDSLDEDDAEKLSDLKKCLDNLNRKKEERAALKTNAKYNLEGEKPTKFFFQLNKNMKSAAQFDTLIVRKKMTMVQ